MNLLHFLSFAALPDNLNPRFLGAREEGVDDHASLGFKEMRAQYLEWTVVAEMDDPFDSFLREWLPRSFQFSFVIARSPEGATRQSLRLLRLRLDAPRNDRF